MFIPEQSQRFKKEQRGAPGTTAPPRYVSVLAEKPQRLLGLLVRRRTAQAGPGVCDRRTATVTDLHDFLLELLDLGTLLVELALVLVLLSVELKGTTSST